MSSCARERAGLGRLTLGAALVALVTLGSTLGTTSARFTTTGDATATSSTRAACASGSAYSTLLATPAYSPTLWWRFANLTGSTTVADASGHASTGTVVGTGLTFGTANAGLVTCDTTYAMRQPGSATSTGFVATSTAVIAPTTLTVATWIRTSALTGGRIIGFGSSSTAGSVQQDRALLLDRSGRVVFHLAVTTGHLLITSPSSVANGTVHLVVATLSGTSAALYVDGVRVASAPTLALAPTYAGYWRAGWEQNIATLIPTSRNQANVRQDEVTVWEGRALSASEVSTLWAANHW
jgi:hypothetical protein